MWYGSVMPQCSNQRTSERAQYIYIYIYIYIYTCYHICGKLEVGFKGSPSSQHQHCTDEAQKAETVLSAVIYIYLYI